MISPSASGSVAATPTKTVVARRVLARLIDDAAMIAIAVGIAMVVGRQLVDRAGVLQLMETFNAEPEPAPPSAAALTVLLLVMAIFVYSLAASALGGRSPGRALTGLTIVRSDSGPVTTRFLLGRELLRMALISLTISIAWPISTAVVVFSEKLGFRADDTASVLVAFAPWLPVAIAAGLWTGAALLDPLERAPHDRVAGTQVVGAYDSGA